MDIIGTMQMMKAAKLMVAALAVMLCTTVTGMAEVIPLASGKSIEGDVIRTNDTSVTIRTRSGVQTYQFYELAKPPIDIGIDFSPGPTPTARGGVSQPGATSSTGATSTVSRSRPDELMQKGVNAVAVFSRIGQILFFLGWLLLVIQGFRVSILWGILNLLFSLISGLIFLVFHPKQGILPFIVMLAGVVVFAMSPLWGLWFYIR